MNMMYTLMYTNVYYIYTYIFTSLSLSLSLFSVLNIMNMNILEVYAPNIPAENTAIQQWLIFFGSHPSKTIFSTT